MNFIPIGLLFFQQIHGVFPALLYPRENLRENSR